MALDGLRRVERRVGRLEDDLDAAQVVAAACLERRRQHAAVELHRARARRQQPGDDTRQRRLARTRFADDADRLAALELQVDVLEDGHRRLAVAPARAVAGAQALHAQQHLGARARRAGAARRRPRRGQQALRVFVLRRGEQALGGADLAHAPVAQHQDVVGHLRHHRQVVADVHRRHLALAHHAAEGAQHLHLRGHVERGGGLVEDHDLGVGDQRHRRHQPLQLPARDLVRVALADGLRLRQRQLAEQRDRLQLGFAARQRAVHDGRLDHLVEDRARWVERGRRALRDVGHGASAQGTQLSRVQREHVHVADAYAAAADAAAAARVAHQRQRRGGLARARFADQRQHLARTDGEAQRIDQRGAAGTDAELVDDDQCTHVSALRVRGPRGPAGCR